MKGTAIIARPPFQVVALSDGLKWRGDAGWRYEGKMDGRWHELGIGQSRIVGELMSDGRFIAFDLPIHDGADIRHAPLRERLAILDTFPLLRPATGSGGTFLEAVLARGGEGVVAKRLDAPYGAAWIKCKRIESFDVVVTSTVGGKLSVEIGEVRDGALMDAGRVSVFSLPVLETLRVGDVIEIAAMCRTVHGKFREPRFVRVRPDKITSHASGLDS